MLFLAFMLPYLLKQMKRLIHILSVFILLPTLLSAQPRCDIRSYNVNDGLGSSMVSTMVQDKDGLIWLGSWSGLSYFDGYSFMNLYNRHGEFGYPINSRILRLCPGKNGGMWCITYDRKINFFNTKSCKYTDVSEVINKKFEPTEFDGICPLENGATWLISLKGQKRLYRISKDLADGEEFTEDDVSDEYERLFGKEDVEVRMVALDKNGVEWILTSEGNYRADGKPSNPADYKGDTGGEKDEYSDSKGRKWKFTDDGSIVLTDERNGLTKTFATGKLPQYSISESPLFVEDKFHTVWVASANCVFSYFDEGKSELQPYLIDRRMLKNDNIDVISRFFVDGQSNIWVLSMPGLSCISPNYRHLQITEITRNVGVRSLCVSKEGNLLAGSVDGNINDLTDNKLIRTIDGRPYCMFADSKGRHWVGTKGNGLFLIEDGNVKHYTNNPADKYSLQGSEVFDVFEDRLHRIWIGCYDGGLNVYDEKADRFINTNNGLPYSNDQSLKVRRFTSTADGIIILSTGEGITAFDGKTQKLEQIKFHYYYANQGEEGALEGGNVMQTVVAKDGTIYLSTMVGGLIKVTSGDLLKDNLQFEQIESTQQWGGIVLSFIEYEDGTLWLARENRIECFNPKTGETVVYGNRDFGQDVVLTEALPVYNKKDGTISMGMLGGVVTFNPKSLHKNDYAPRIVFSSVQYQGELVKQPILFADEFDVPSDKRNLTINFSALNYENNSMIRYAYKLESDEKWNYLGEGHSASFHNLPCGHIKLLVKSTNGDGVWMDNVEVLNIYSHPTFWETIWAKLLVLLLLGGFIYATVYFLHQHHIHQMERKELQDRLEKLLHNFDMAKKETSEPKEKVVGIMSIEDEPIAENAPAAQSDTSEENNLHDVHIEQSENQFMTSVMEFMEENIGNSDLKVADISDYLGMSRSVFYGNLKKITGMSPVDFIKYLRIQRAKQLISSSNLSLSEIAYRVGFSDPNYFGKSFKKTVGIPPSEYREKASLQKTQ